MCISQFVTQVCFSFLILNTNQSLQKGKIKITLKRKKQKSYLWPSWHMDLSLKNKQFYEQQGQRWNLIPYSFVSQRCLVMPWLLFFSTAFIYIYFASWCKMHAVTWWGWSQAGRVVCTARTALWAAQGWLSGLLNPSGQIVHENGKSSTTNTNELNSPRKWNRLSWAAASSEAHVPVTLTVSDSVLTAQKDFNTGASWIP